MRQKVRPWAETADQPPRPGQHQPAVFVLQTAATDNARRFLNQDPPTRGARPLFAESFPRATFQFAERVRYSSPRCNEETARLPGSHSRSCGAGESHPTDG